MAINIKNQSFFSEIGKRANNEDNGGWNEGSTYIVCDGVGGNERGEIASEIITNTLLQIYKENLSTPIDLALKTAENKLSNYIAQNPESLGMASTLVMTIIKTNGIQLAWVGDSRIYQFRNGEIIFRTTDHSWVNEALAAGILTAAEAENHPKSNVITRAIQGNHKTVQAQEVWLTDIQKNDMFLLCSDGVLETWTDQELCLLFSNSEDTDFIANKIKQECAETSKDNNTAIVYKIESIDGFEPLNQISKSDGEVKVSVADDSFSHIENNKSKKHKLIIILLLSLILISLGVLLTLMYNQKIKPENTNSSKNKIERVETIKKKSNDIEVNNKPSIENTPNSNNLNVVYNDKIKLNIQII
jgi:serine/threonine protein phosphatase PrpC